MYRRYKWINIGDVDHNEKMMSRCTRIKGANKGRQEACLREKRLPSNFILSVLLV